MSGINDCFDDDVRITINIYSEDQDIVDYLKKEANLSFVTERDVVLGLIRKQIRDEIVSEGLRNARKKIQRNDA